MIEEQIKIVAEARQKREVLADLKRQRLAEWESEHEGLLRDIADNSQFLTDAEAVLRDTTVKIFNETGNKAPAPGVGIREVTKLDYDPKEALKWAMAHQIALSLDKKSFEGFAKATRLEFVQVTQEPQATIATDLSKYLTKDTRLL